MDDGLPPLREVIAAHDLRARKSLGQNFLLDLNLTRRIARAAGANDGGIFYEVGPGPGGLTRALLAEGAARVVAVEHDARCLPALEEIASGESTPNATGLDSRSVFSCSVIIGLPRNKRLSVYPIDSGTGEAFAGVEVVTSTPPLLSRHWLSDARYSSRRCVSGQAGTSPAAAFAASLRLIHRCWWRLGKLPLVF